MAETDAQHWREKSQKKKRKLPQSWYRRLTDKLPLSRKILFLLTVLAAVIFIANDLDW